MGKLFTEFSYKLRVCTNIRIDLFDMVVEIGKGIVYLGRGKMGMGLDNPIDRPTHLFPFDGDLRHLDPRFFEDRLSPA